MMLVSPLYRAMASATCPPRPPLGKIFGRQVPQNWLLNSGVFSSLVLVVLGCKRNIPGLQHSVQKAPSNPWTRGGCTGACQVHLVSWLRRPLLFLGAGSLRAVTDTEGLTAVQMQTLVAINSALHKDYTLRRRTSIARLKVCVV